MNINQCRKIHLYDINWQLKMSSVLLLSYILLLLTSLRHGNAFLLTAVFLCMLMIKRRINVSHTGFLFILCLSFVIYLFCTPFAWKTAYLTTGLLNIAAITVFYVTLADINVQSINTGNWSNIFDLIILFFILICFEQLTKYASLYIGNWPARRNGLPLFIGNSHHVDFSVLVFIAFLLGMKRGYRKISLTFAIIACIILPTRTFYLSIILFIFCYLFKDAIYMICSRKLLRKSFTWIMIFTIGSAIFSWLWVVPMNQRLEAERLEATLYAIRVIMKQRLFFCGLDGTIDYGKIIPNFQWKYFSGDIFQPHNSYYSLFLNHSIFLGGCYLFSLSKVIDKVFSRELVPYIIPYLLAGWVLHDMFIGGRLILYLIVLTVPFRETSKHRIKIFHKKFKILLI